MKVKVLTPQLVGGFILALVMVALALAPIRFDFAGVDLSFLAHIGATALLTVVIGGVLRKRIPDLYQQASFASVLALGFWIGIEGVQTIVPDHGAQVSDMLFDGLGASIGFVLALLIAEIFY